MQLLPAPVGLLVALTHPQWEMRLSDRLSASALGSPQTQSAAHSLLYFIPDQLHFAAMGVFWHVKISFSFCTPSWRYRIFTLVIFLNI